MVHDADAAKHIVQHTYLKMIQRFGRTSNTPILHAKAYLFNACIRNAITYLEQGRSAPIFAPDPSEVENVADHAPGPEKIALLEDLMEQLGKIVDGLPPKQRQVFQLGQIEGVPRREIAERLDLSEDSVTNLTTRALRNVKARLSALGFDSVLDIAQEGGSPS
jgi:RNA polymerase sigma factor (sigma-70 family)